MFWLRGSRSALSESVNGVHQCCFLAANRSLEPRDPTHLEVTQTRARTLCWLRLCVHTLHILFLVHLVPFITLFPCTARSLSRVSKNGNPTSKRSENEKKKKRIVKNLTTGFDSHSKIQQSSLSWYTYCLAFEVLFFCRINSRKNDSSVVPWEPPWGPLRPPEAPDLGLTFPPCGSSSTKVCVWVWVQHTHSKSSVLMTEAGICTAKKPIKTSGGTEQIYCNKDGDRLRDRDELSETERSKR